MAFWDFFTKGKAERLETETQAVYDAGSRVFAVAGPSSPPKGELRDIPVVDILQWNVNSIRSAVGAHVNGQFGNGALLTDAMLADDRIQGAINGRTKGVTRAAVMIEPNPKAKNPALAKQIAVEIEECWDDLFPESILEDILKWQVFQGFSLNELIWEVKQDKYVPRIKAWHPLYTYFNISDRKYYAFTIDGVLEVEPNDPKWALYTPYGYYRGWMRGAVRSVSIPWLVRQFALRDWARYSEVHGLPQKKAKVPAQAPAEDKRRFFNAVKRLGSESAFLLPMPASGMGEWDVDLLEARDTAWKGFDGLIERCDKSITLTIRGTNLTTQVQTGTGAATQAHREEDSDYAEADGKKLAQFLRKQVLMFYCLYNYGDPDLAPLVSFEAVEEEDRKKDADTMVQVATALTALEALGWEMDAKEVSDKFFDGMKIRVKSPEEKLQAAQDMMKATTPPDSKDDEDDEDSEARLDAMFFAATEHDERGRFTGPGAEHLPEGKMDHTVSQGKGKLGTSRLTPEDKKAIKQYSGDHYRQVRDANTGKSKNPQHVEMAAKLDQALAKADPSPGTAYRGVKNLSKEQADKLLSQDVIHHATPTSYSRSPWNAKDFLGIDADPGRYNVLFKVDHKSGVDISHLASKRVAKAEQETLMPKGSSFKVTKRYVEKDPVRGTHTVVVEGVEA